ncbi:MAG TPA: BrnT family toxin [Candidatus Aquicultor sp.]|jgi:hypothetical protein
MRIDDFEWDEGNIEKNLLKHNVTPEEAEEAFYSYPRKVFKAKYGRYHLYGQTEAGRLLFVVFELKGTVARVISTRDMDKKERKLFKS